MLFRTTLLCLLLVCVVSSASCSRKSRAQRENEEAIKLDQNVTSLTKPKDVIFIDFEKNWRKFIAVSPEFTLPVISLKEPKQKEAWQPLILAECTFSADAGGYVPQVTLVWNEPVPQVTPEIPGARKGQQRPEQQDTSKVRFDLAVHYQGFEKNQYSTALSTEKQNRFNLPSNSELVSHPEAILLTGPSLFPKLMDFRSENLRERDTNREVVKKTLVLRDLSPGLTYTIRVCVRGENQWSEEKQFVFLTPVCFKEF